MRELYFRWGAGILCLMLLILPSVLPPPVVEDSATEKAMLPPCDVEEGLPFIENDEVFKNQLNQSFQISIFQ